MNQLVVVTNKSLLRKAVLIQWISCLGCIGFIFFSACNGNSGDQEVVVQDSVVVDSFVNPHDSIAPLTTGLYIWSVDFDNKTKIRNPLLKPAFVQVDSIIKGLNILHPDIILKKAGFGGDTLYSTIANSQVLTEQMGSSGAAAYLADAVINLTAVPGVRHVRIDFTAGSHAEPDTWSAAQFDDYIEVRP